MLPLLLRGMSGDLMHEGCRQGAQAEVTAPARQGTAQGHEVTLVRMRLREYKLKLTFMQQS